MSGEHTRRLNKRLQTAPHDVPLTRAYWPSRVRQDDQEFCRLVDSQRYLRGIVLGEFFRHLRNSPPSFPLRATSEKRVEVALTLKVT